MNRQHPSFLYPGERCVKKTRDKKGKRVNRGVADCHDRFEDNFAEGKHLCEKVAVKCREFCKRATLLFSQSSNKALHYASNSEESGMERAIHYSPELSPEIMNGKDSEYALLIIREYRFSSAMHIPT